MQPQNYDKRNNAFNDIFGRVGPPAPHPGHAHPSYKAPSGSGPHGPSRILTSAGANSDFGQAISSSYSSAAGPQVGIGNDDRKVDSPYAQRPTVVAPNSSGAGIPTRTSFYSPDAGHFQQYLSQTYEPQSVIKPTQRFESSQPTQYFRTTGVNQDSGVNTGFRSKYAPSIASGPEHASTSAQYSPNLSCTSDFDTHGYISSRSGLSAANAASTVLNSSSSPSASSSFTPIATRSMDSYNPRDDFPGFDSSSPMEYRDYSAGSQLAESGSFSGPSEAQFGSQQHTGGVEGSEEFDPLRSHYPYYDQVGYTDTAQSFERFRKSSADSDGYSLHRGVEPVNPLLTLNPSFSSVTSTLPPYSYSGSTSNGASYSQSRQTVHPRRSSESVRVMPTQPKAIAYQDRSSSFSGANAVRPDLKQDGQSARTIPLDSNSVALVPRKTPVVYPALLSRVAEAFKSRVIVTERVKDGLVYSDTFDGRDAVDKIAYIIKTTDRNLALLLGRALDAQKFFHDVTYDHRLRDSPVELYQFRERLSSPFLSTDDLLRDEIFREPVNISKNESIAGMIASDDTSSFPSGVFTLLTDCYSSTCTRDRLCYSIACPRRLEQQARLNLKPKPGLQRTLSSESLGDLREPGSLWIHSVPQEVADSTSEAEKTRQEALNEVFYTERDFVRDMEYLRDFWIKPLRSSTIIAEEKREDFVTQVFWNVLEVYSVSFRLCDLLNKRQKAAHVVEKVGDIFLDLVPHFSPFVKYGAHQLYGKYEFEKEKNSNPAFAKFVDETERLPESRKLELNGYLTKPTTRLGRYPLLLAAVLKNTPDDNPDKKMLPKVIKLVKEFLDKVNYETGRSENRFNLAQLDQQLVFRNGEAVDLRLRDNDRDMIYKGPLKKRGGAQSEAAELQVFLFDHAILMVKQKTKNEQFKVYRKPIPLELLVVAPIDDASSARAGSARPKSLMSRGSNSRYPANAPPGVDKHSKQGFAMTFIHLGRRGYQITLWSASWAGRKKWLEKIEGRQSELRERSLVFETLPLSAGYFVGSNRVTCAVPFDHGNRIVYGTDNGVYLSDIGENGRVPVKVISVINVTQLDILDEQGILVVLADKAVQTFFVDNLDPGDAVGAAKRAKKISLNATFFKAGQCLGRTLVCVVKSGSVSSTIRTLEPIDQVKSKKQPTIRKFLQGSNESLRVFKEFYIPTESSSVHFLKSKLCVGCTKGFEIVDLETLDTQGLLDPADSSLDFVQRRDSARPIAIYRVEGEFLLCYDEFAFYVNKNGWRAKSNWIIQWEGFPTSFALHYPYILAFEPTFIEIRHVESGALMQIIPGNNLRCLWADSPPVSSSNYSTSYFSNQNTRHGYTDVSQSSRPKYSTPMSAQKQSEIIFGDGDRIFSLHFTAPSERG